MSDCTCCDYYQPENLQRSCLERQVLEFASVWVARRQGVICAFGSERRVSGGLLTRPVPHPSRRHRPRLDIANTTKPRTTIRVDIANTTSFAPLTSPTRPSGAQRFADSRPSGYCPRLDIANTTKPRPTIRGDSLAEVRGLRRDAVVRLLQAPQARSSRQTSPRVQTTQFSG